MIAEVIMPQGGQDIEKGVVLRWLKAVGDPVRKGEVLCEVETEKAVFDVEAPQDGYLIKILVPEGSEVPILGVIGTIGTLEDMNQLEPAKSQDESQAVAYDAGAIRDNPSEGLGSRKPAGEKISISPRARKLALEKGIAIENVRGSGPGGRVIEQDVLEALGKWDEGKSPPSQSQVPGGRLVPMTKIRKLTAERMQQSKRTAPHFYMTVSADMTDARKFLSGLRERMEQPADDALSLNDLIVRASALALREFPEVNSSVKDEDSVIQWEDVNIGIAVALQNGLVVPVLERADKLSLRETSEQIRRLVALAGEGKQASLVPGRFTISNLGMFHVDNFIAIIKPPESAILAVSSVERKVVALGEEVIGVREIMNITLSIDHRVIDGVVAAKFLNRIKSLLEDPHALA